MSGEKGQGSRESLPKRRGIREDLRSRWSSSRIDSERGTPSFEQLPQNSGIIRFIDLFSGIGGFRLGLERSNCGVQRIQGCDSRSQEGWEWGSGTLLQQTRGDSCINWGSPQTKGNFRCVWSCDVNKYANQVYTKHFGEENHHPGNIEGINTEDIPDFDLLCAGFPCQAFSVAGKRKGFKDTRGTLFFEICRIARDKRPSLLLLENVKGLLSHDGGRTFTIVLQSLDELGYWLEWQVLNSKYFGVPQNRERVFIVGHLREGSSKPLFPITGVYKDSPERDKIESWGQIGATLSSKSAGGRNARGNYVVTPRKISTALDANYWKGPDKHDARTIIIDYLNRSIREDETFNTIKTSQGSPSSSSALAISFTNPHNSEEIRKLNLSSESRAVKPPYGNQNPLTLDGLKIRRLTPIECERLQGFPDQWTEGVSDTQRYRLLGNAVTVNVIEFLGDLILSSFTNMGDKEE